MAGCMGTIGCGMSYLEGAIGWQNGLFSRFFALILAFLTRIEGCCAVRKSVLKGEELGPIAECIAAALRGALVWCGA